MNTGNIFRRISRRTALLSVCALQMSALSWSAAQEPPHAQVAPAPPMQLAQARQCERREGPFVSQDTALQQKAQAQARGFAVSRGVVPCRDQYATRGYCFFVFYAC
jgi:hypothetical protein